MELLIYMYIYITYINIYKILKNYCTKYLNNSDMNNIAIIELLYN